MYHGVRVQDSHHRRSRRRPRGCAESRPDATPGGPKAGSHRPRIERETDVVDITAGATAKLSALPYSRTADDPKGADFQPYFQPERASHHGRQALDDRARRSPKGVASHANGIKQRRGCAEVNGESEAWLGFRVRRESDIFARGLQYLPPHLVFIGRSKCSDAGKRESGAFEF